MTQATRALGWQFYGRSPELAELTTILSCKRWLFVKVSFVAVAALVVGLPAILVPGSYPLSDREICPGGPRRTMAIEPVRGMLVPSMKLPNGDRAVVELAKLTDYCLNPSHPRGRHKARVFAARLGFTAEHAEILRRILLAAASDTHNAVRGVADAFGERYVLDFETGGPKGVATIRSAWIIRAQEDFPRFATCYLL